MSEKSPAEVLADQLNAQVGADEAETTSAQETVETEAAASTEASQAADETTTESTADAVESSPAGRSAKLQKILDKYNGDEDLAADSIHESWNSMSRLRKDLEELKSHLIKPEAQSFEADPDIQGLKGEISALDQELQFNDSSRRGLISEIDSLKTDIAVLEGQLRLADEFQKAALIQQKQLSERELKGLLRQWTTLGNSDARLNREKSALNRQLRQSENHLKSLEFQRQQQTIQSQSVQKEILKDFVSEVVDLAAAHNIEDGDVVEHMISTLKAEAHLYLSGIPENSPGIDIPAFVKARGQAYLKAQGALKTKSFAAHSNAKAALSRTTAGQVPGNGKAPKPFAPKNAAEAKAWAAAKLAELATKRTGA